MSDLNPESNLNRLWLDCIIHSSMFSSTHVMCATPDWRPGRKEFIEQMSLLPSCPSCVFLLWKERFRGMCTCCVLDWCPPQPNFRASVLPVAADHAGKRWCWSFGSLAHLPHSSPFTSVYFSHANGTVSFRSGSECNGFVARRIMRNWSKIKVKKKKK